MNESWRSFEPTLRGLGLEAAFQSEQSEAGLELLFDFEDARVAGETEPGRQASPQLLEPSTIHREEVARDSMELLQARLDPDA